MQINSGFEWRLGVANMAFHQVASVQCDRFFRERPADV